MNPPEATARRPGGKAFRPARSAAAWGIPLLVAGLSVLLTSGNIRSADYVSAFSVARNLVADGSVTATPVDGFADWAVNEGANGKPYTRYGLGHSMLGIPGIAIGRLMAMAPGPVEGAFGLQRVRFYPVERR